MLEQEKDLHFVISALFVLLMSAGVYYLGGSGLATITGFEVLNASPCPILINNDTNFTANITETLLGNQACITVNASNIVIDCLGYQLLGNRTGTGINISGFNNITLRNCPIINFSTNLILFNASGNLIVNSSFRNATQASMVLNQSHNNTITNSSSDANATNSFAALIVDNSTNNTIHNNTFTNGPIGVALMIINSNNNSITNNTARAYGDGSYGGLIGDVGIYVFRSYNTTVSNNLAITRDVAAINIHHSNYTTVINNNATAEAPNPDLNFGDAMILIDAHFSTIANNYVRAVTSAAFVIFDNTPTENMSSTRNIIANNTIIGQNTIGLSIYQFSNRNNFTNNTIIALGTAAAMDLRIASNNTFVNNTLESNGSFAIQFIDSSRDNNFTSTTIRTNDTWVSTGSPALRNNMTDTYFTNSNGTLRITNRFTLDNATNITTTSLNISMHRIFVNSTLHNFLNTSSQLLLRNVTLTDPQPTVDENHDELFSTCSEPRCTEVSYLSNIFLFNVTSFTTYSFQETPTAPGQGGRGSVASSSSSSTTITKPKEEPKCISEWICNDWGTCVDGTQFRECADSNSCNDLNSRPSIEKRCSVPNPKLDKNPSTNTVKTELPENYQQNIQATSFGLVITILTIVLYIYYTKQQQ